MGCYNSCVVNAPVDKVWKTLRNFHDMSWAAGVVTECKPVGKLAGDQIGAKRILNGAFHETLRALDDASREFKYSIDDGPDVVAKDRVSGYIAHVCVFPVTAGNQTFVEWRSTWQQADGDVKSFCDPIYAAVLAALVKHYA